MGKGQFNDTRWSLIAQVRGEDREASLRATGELFQIYWLPLYWFIRRSGWPENDVEDLLQDFAAAVIEKDLLARADPARGRLRSFLLKTLQRHLNDVRRSSQAIKRGGDVKHVSIDADAGEQLLGQVVESDEVQLDDGFDRIWARSVFNAALDRLAAEAQAKGNETLFVCCRPLLVGAENVEMSELATQLGMELSAARVALHRLRKRFREAIREEVQQTIGPLTEGSAEEDDGIPGTGQEDYRIPSPLTVQFDAQYSRKGVFIELVDDDYGYNVAENPVHVHDLHATILHLLGIDHELLTHKFQGRRFRLTDVHGRIVNELLA